MAYQPEGIVSSDWLVMMSPNNQPFSGKQIYVAEGGQETEEAGTRKKKGREQSKVNNRLFVTEVKAEIKMRKRITIPIYVPAYNLQIAFTCNHCYCLYKDLQGSQKLNGMSQVIQ